MCCTTHTNNGVYTEETALFCRLTIKIYRIQTSSEKVRGKNVHSQMNAKTRAEDVLVFIPSRSSRGVSLQMEIPLHLPQWFAHRLASDYTFIGHTLLSQSFFDLISSHQLNFMKLLHKIFSKMLLLPRKPAAYLFMPLRHSKCMFLISVLLNPQNKFCKNGCRMWTKKNGITWIFSRMFAEKLRPKFPTLQILERNDEWNSA